MTGPILKTFGINTLSIESPNRWVRLALGKILYCDIIPTLTKSHLNSKSAMDFFFNLYKKWSRNYTKCIG